MKSIKSIAGGVSVFVVLSAVTLLAQDVDTASFVTTAGASDSAAPTAVQGLECCAVDPMDRWTATAGGIILHRSTARPSLLVEQRTTSAKLSDVADFDLGVAVGPRVELSRRVGCDWEIGATYFGIDGWSVTRSVADAGNLRVPLVSDSDYFDTASAVYESRFYSTEINLKRKWTDWLSTLIGFRWVELHEHVQGEARSTSLEGLFDIRSHNCLYGIQLGTEVTVWDHGGPLHVNGFLKGGMYANAMEWGASGQGTYLNSDITLLDERTAFLGEIGLTATYRLNRNWSVYAGYEALWLNGVSLAADAVSAMNNQDLAILFNGDAFYHGAMTGVSLTW